MNEYNRFKFTKSLMIVDDDLNDFINTLNEKYEEENVDEYDEDDFLHSHIHHFVSSISTKQIEDYIFRYGLLKSLQDYKNYYGMINIDNDLTEILYFVIITNIDIDYI